MTHRLGATPHGDGSCTFTVWAPHATRVQVSLRGSDNDAAGAPRLVALEPATDADGAGVGYFSTRVADVSAGARYAFLLDDDPLELPDPASASQPDGVHASSAVVDHGAFAWSDAGWRGLPLRHYVIYELHVGTFTEAGTFDAAIGRLDELAELGVTAIELLPIAEFPGARGWGYDGVDLYAPHSAYGGPDGLKRLVDAAHARDMCVVLDVVYNHLGPEGNYLTKFGPYFSDRHTTPWGAAVNVDGPGSDEVRRFFLDNAVGWVRDYHVDALRLDAIHGIVDTSASPFLAELTSSVRVAGEIAGRQVQLIAESDLNDPRTVRPYEAYGTGFDAQWLDDFHHTLHVLLTGEGDGYYADTAAGDPLWLLSESLQGGFVGAGEHSPMRGRRHGAPAWGTPGERFVVYAQNHDQVGNRLLGDRLASTLTPAQLRLAAATVLLSPFVPMLFMGEEYGATTPFPYFTSHGDEALVAAVREGRAREFAAFGHAGEAPDPQGEATFRSAVLDWSQRSEAGYRELLAWHRELLALRAASPSILLLRVPLVQVGMDPDGGGSGWLTLEREYEERTVTVLNFGSEPVSLLQVLGEPDEWRRELDSGETRFGGDGVEAGTVGAGAAAVFRWVEQSEGAAS